MSKEQQVRKEINVLKDAMNEYLKQPWQPRPITLHVSRKIHKLYKELLNES